AAPTAARRHPTTPLPAARLAAPAGGYAVPQVAALVTAALRGDEAVTATTQEDVLAIGHSSGRDLASGLAGCLRVLALLPHAVPPPTAPEPAPQPAGRDLP
ncbi:MAG: oxamate carbamoyltransferase subunit AllH family protein, partial [Oryzihumus sp.]